MIASAGTGSSFGGLQQYLLRGQDQERGAGEGLQEYPLSGRSREEADRVAWTSVRDLPIDDPEKTGRLMEATARQNVRVQKSVYHLSLPGLEAPRARGADRRAPRHGAPGHPRHLEREWKLREVPGRWYRRGRELGRAVAR